MPDAWRPEQYERFKAERAQPALDLLALVRPAPGGRAVDLGCGTGEWTLKLHQAAGMKETVGVDRSAAMLAKSSAFAGGGVRFERAEVEAFEAGALDVVFSNAALHWVGDHPGLFQRITRWLRPGGQLVVHMPINADHASHRTARAMEAESPWREELGGPVQQDRVLAPERYAELLEELGYAEQSVRVQVYGHRLPSRDDVVEWVKGSLLTDYEARLRPERFAAFVAAYRERLAQALPDRRPFFYTYKRLFLWGRRSN